ncbi:hypothetical protein CPC08DRAFT_123050 [Agrocybe pediades]|nr:hypothetical protein CPC08DRAFT_123050 [Agrocybe pediades]
MLCTRKHLGRICPGPHVRRVSPSSPFFIVVPLAVPLGRHGATCRRGRKTCRSLSISFSNLGSVKFRERRGRTDSAAGNEQVDDELLSRWRESFEPLIVTTRTSPSTTSAVRFGFWYGTIVFPASTRIESARQTR